MATTAIEAPLGFFGVILQALRLVVRKAHIIVLLAFATLLLNAGLVALFLSVSGGFYVGDIAIIGVAAFVLTIICSFYMYGFIARLVVLQMHGRRASFWQVARGLRGKVLIRLMLTGLLVVIVVAIGYVLLVVPGIAAMIYLLFALPAVVNEDLAYWPAMRRSYHLVKGHWWYAFGCVLLAGLLLGILQLLAGMIIGGVLSGGGLPSELAQALGEFVGMLFLLPAQFAVPVVLYHDVRLRKGEVGLQEPVVADT